MEILLIIIFVLAALFVLGGLDNRRPVSSWSDGKLKRMYNKLSNVSRNAFMAGNYKLSEEYDDKIEEIRVEIESRAAKSRFKYEKSDDATQSLSTDTRPDVRSIKDITKELDIGMEEFARVFSSYWLSLASSGKSRNWNAEIDGYARSIGALTEDEIEKAKTDLKQATINRVVVRYRSGN